MTVIVQIHKPQEGSSRPNVGWYVRFYTDDDSGYGTRNRASHEVTLDLAARSDATAKEEVRGLLVQYKKRFGLAMNTPDRRYLTHVSRYGSVNNEVWE